MIFCVDIYLEFQENEKNRNDTIEYLKNNYAPSISISVWTYDREVTSALTTAISQFEHIEKVEVLDQFETVFSSSGESLDKELMVHDIELLSPPSSSNRVKIGMIRVYLSNKKFYEKLRHEILGLFLSRLFKSFFLAVFVYFLITRLVVKPLLRIVSQLTYENKDPVYIEEKDKSREVNFLIDSLNELKTKNELYIKEANQAQQEVSEYNKILQDEQEKVRKQISFFLHDSIGQNLASLKLSSQVKGMDSEFVDNIEMIISEVKELSYDILPAPVVNATFKESVDWLLNKSTNLKELKVEVSDDCESLPLNSQINLYRIIQELLQNSMKYSKMQSLEMYIKSSGDTFAFLYHSKGPETEFRKSENSNSLGNVTIEERVKYINGKIISNKVGDSSYKLEIHFKDTFI